MKTEQINIRLDAELVSALERVAREESLDRATAIRRLLESSIKEWELERSGSWSARSSGIAAGSSRSGARPRNRV